MGRLRRSRVHKGRKAFYRGTRTSARQRDLDQVQDDLKRFEETGVYDVIGADKEGMEEVAGGGRFPCVPCAKYLVSAQHLAEHQRGKGHKKRVKLLREPAYTQAEAEAAAGMGSYATKQ